MTKEGPLNTIRVGRGIKATLWRNEGRNGPWVTVQFSRTYKQDDGSLQDSSRFAREDLLYVAHAAQKVFDYLLGLCPK